MPDGRLRPFIFSFTDSHDDTEEAAARNKSKIYNTLRRVLKDLVNVEDMVGNETDDNLGTHSIRKYASTRTRSNGISKDDKDHRGRWHRMRVSDHYDDIELDYVDAKVAAVLCPGGVCNYVVVDPACTPEWIATNVCPNVRQVFGDTLSLLFGRAILWCAFSSVQDLLPSDMLEQITTAYNQVRTVANNRNPIEKRLVHVSGHEGTVFMEDFVEAEEDQGVQMGNASTGVQPQVPRRVPAVGGGNSRDLLVMMGSNLQAMRRQITEQANTIDNLKATLRNTTKAVNRLINKVDANPLRAMQRAADNRRAAGVANVPPPPQQEGQVDDDCDPNALLSACPRSLERLWMEYTHGIGGNKPAKHFTRVERGRWKHKYSRRKNFWDLMNVLMRTGHARTSTEAISMIRQAYGQSASVTTVINSIIGDRNNGTIRPVFAAVGVR